MAASSRIPKKTAKPRKVRKKNGPRPGQPGNPGRPKGTPNRRTDQLREALAARGCQPWEFLADVMAGKEFQAGDKDIVPDLDHRIAAAKALMPYVQPKLKTVEMRHEFPSGLPALHIFSGEAGGGR